MQCSTTEPQEHCKLTQYIVIGRTPQAHVGNVTSLTIIMSFSFQVSFISSSLKGEQSRVTDTGMMLVCICSTQAAVKTISDGLYTPLWYDPVPLTHTHTNTHMRNSAFEQSIANTWTNNKTYLQSLIQKHQIVIAKSELTHFLFYFFWNRLCAKPALHSTRFTKLSSIKCAAQIRTFGLCCSVVNNLNLWFLIASTFGRPNKMILLSHRNTQRLPVMAASTLLQLLKPRLLSLREHLGGIMQIFPHRDVNVGSWDVLGGRGRVLTLIKNISLGLRL